MNKADFFEAVGYFANPRRNTRIEVEARQRTINNYAPTYLAQTGLPLPVTNDAVCILPDDANKWGREMRIYFTRTDRSVLPNIIAGLETGGGRFGYDKWNQRLNNKDIIDELFDYKYVIGEPQDEVAIRLSVPAGSVTDFDRGYNLP